MQYVKLDQREHVLTRPGMYIGSIDEDTYNTWVFDDREKKVTKRVIKIIPALYKIFDEILVNAIDHTIRMKMAIANDPDSDVLLPVKNIRVVIDRENGSLSVTNDGNGIEVEKHPEHGVWIPELIFGHMLTSTNYDDTQEKIIGGQNGIGAKACNIFSKSFKIETIDHIRRKLYTQEFRNNMSERDPPVVKACAKKPYTTITFVPDYERFGVKEGGMSDDMYALLMRRVYDICALTDSDVNVWLNGVKLEFKTFERYVDLYLGGKGAFRAYERINERWEVAVSYNDVPGFEQISFVNGMWTIKGGKHVECITNQITTKMIDMIAKKKKDTDVKPQHVKNYLMVFVRSTISNPAFTSQSKEDLTTPISKFGGAKPEISDKLVEKLFKSEFTEKVLNLCDSAAAKTMKKTDGKKRATIRDIPTLDDANWAGTAKSRECTLILTEGLSAKAMALCGLNVVGRDRWGVFPLKGKLLNVKDVAVKKLLENDEITNIKKILGLETGREYKDISELRYGRVMCMCDSDEDGNHIKGLLFNLFQTLWPSLFKSEGFITSLLTPVVKAKKGDDTLNFYSVVEYEQWKEQVESTIRAWNIKYYKGLGTSTDKEAKEYFREMKMVEYIYTPKESDDAIELAFNKKFADKRKEWLGEYDRKRILDFKQMRVSYEDFVHKGLIHFSNYDIVRSIPSVCDGLKVSQRKIMYGCFKKKLHTEIRVQQLSGYISEQTCYHHGEASLQGAIVGMAQNFVGSNNVHLLLPIGQFGTRCFSAGKDAASPRYIHTHLSPVTELLYRSEENPILVYLDEDGYPVEPEFYVPILPMVLVNGAIGIGTGFATNIPCYNPKDIMVVVRRALDGEPWSLDMIDGIKPWYRGFTGQIEVTDKGKYVSRGRFMRISPTSVRVTELPIGYWTDDFKQDIEELAQKTPDIRDIELHYTNTTIDFVIVFASESVCDSYMALDTSNNYTRFDNVFKLVSPRMLSTQNMVLFNAKGQIQKYDTILDIIREHYDVRITTYVKRIAHLTRALEKELLILRNRARFVNAIMDDSFVIYKRAKDAIVADLTKQKYDPHPENGDFEYLLSMPLYSLTQEKLDKLAHEIKANEGKLRDLESTTPQEYWKRELDELEPVLDVHLEEYQKTDEDDKGASGSKKKTVRRKVVGKV